MGNWLRRLTAAYLVFAALLIADPLGLGQRAAYAAYDAIITVRSFALGARDDRARPEKTAVVLITDRAIIHANASIPMPFSMTADLLDAIAAAGPKAIYLDFAYGHDRDDAGLPYLAETVRIISETTPVFVSTVRSDAGYPFPVLPALACGGPETCSSPILSLTSNKTLVDDQLSNIALGRSDGSEFPSPASALYCNVPKNAVSSDVCIDVIPKYFDIVWPVNPPICSGAGAPDFGVDAACAAIPDRYISFLLQNAGASLLNSISSIAGGQDRFARLRSAPTIGLTETLALTPDVEAKLHNSVVFVGSESDLTGGNARSPIYGFVPSVFKHEAAYQTLSLYDGTPPRSAEIGEGPGLLRALLIGTAFFIVFGVMLFIASLAIRSLVPTVALLGIDFLCAIAATAIILTTVGWLRGTIEAAALMGIFSVAANSMMALFVHMIIGRSEVPE